MINNIETSITKEYRKTIFKPFIRAINDFSLIEENDKIAVCISGGKDSFLMSKCLEELKRHNKVNFELVNILMDPGYDDKHLKDIQEVSSKLNIKLHIFKSNIFNEIAESNNKCYLCARKRRGYLYNEALKLGCNKIALGHHFYDVIETFLLSLIFNGKQDIMKPILDSTNYKGMKLIRPLYYVREENIISWAKTNNLKFIDCACTVTKNSTSKRIEMRQLIKYINTINKDGDKNILNSLLK
ncbi:MAG: ATP-binding protein [Bacilli bacterium]